MPLLLQPLAALGRYVSHPRVCLVSLRDLKLNGPIALLKATVLDFHHAARPIGDHDCRPGLRFGHFSTPDSIQIECYPGSRFDTSILRQAVEARRSEIGRAHV